ncbi:hypothetical protein, partial [Streptomyces sp900116325]|uniref:hypothetical protein n=1 Tax=Streptomyces sp. 900116325 TaxID=3154295 RepID=UPI0033A41C04
CRKVLLTADPEPAFSRGNDDMIMTVAGGITWLVVNRFGARAVCTAGLVLTAVAFAGSGAG